MAHIAGLDGRADWGDTYAHPRTGNRIGRRLGYCKEEKGKKAETTRRSRTRYGDFTGDEGKGRLLELQISRSLSFREFTGGAAGDLFGGPQSRPSRDRHLRGESRGRNITKGSVLPSREGANEYTDVRFVFGQLGGDRWLRINMPRPSLRAI